MIIFLISTMIYVITTTMISNMLTVDLQIRVGDTERKYLTVTILNSINAGIALGLAIALL